MSDCEELKIITFNANGFGEFKNRKDIFDFLRKQSANVFSRQETHRKTEAENAVKSQLGFDRIAARPYCGSKGVAVLFKNNFEYKIHNIVKYDERRYIRYIY